MLTMEKKRFVYFGHHNSHATLLQVLSVTHEEPQEGTLWNLETCVSFFIIFTHFRKTLTIQEVPHKGSCGVLDGALELTPRDLYRVPSQPALCSKMRHLTVVLLRFLSSSLQIMFLQFKNFSVSVSLFSHLITCEFKTLIRASLC